MTLPWLKFHRATLDSPVMQDPIRFHLWMTWLAEAANEPETRKVMPGVRLHLDAGETFITTTEIERAYGLDRRAARRLLAWFRSDGCATTEPVTDKHGRTIGLRVRIANWARYQQKGSDAQDPGTSLSPSMTPSSYAETEENSDVAGTPPGTSLSPSRARVILERERLEELDPSSQTRAKSAPSEEEGSHNHGVEGSGADNPTPQPAHRTQPATATKDDHGTTSENQDGATDTAPRDRERELVGAGDRRLRGDEHPRTGSAPSDARAEGGPGPSASVQPQTPPGPSGRVTGRVAGAVGQQLPAAPIVARSTRRDGAIDVGEVASVTIPRGLLRSAPVVEDGVVELHTRVTPPDDIKRAIYDAGWRWDRGSDRWVAPDSPAIRAALARLCPWSVPSQATLPLDGRAELRELRPPGVQESAEDRAERVRAGCIQQLLYESRRGGIVAAMAKQQLREMGAA